MAGHILRVDAFHSAEPVAGIPDILNGRVRGIRGFRQELKD